MSTYIVTYDLHASGQNYDCLYKKLNSYAKHWHVQQSVWIIETSQAASKVRDSLSPCLDANDKLFVGKLSGEAAWAGYDQKTGEWLKSCLEPVN